MAKAEIVWHSRDGQGTNSMSYPFETQEEHMNNSFDMTGKAAFVTGAARGQGRSHALLLAEQGADIVASDICDQIDTVPYPMGTKEDLEETVRLVAATGRDVIAESVDVRNLAGLQTLVERGISEFGRLDVVVANAATVNGIAPLWEISDAQFRDQIDVNLFGVWNTIKATVPHMIDQNSGGSIILIASVAGIAAELNVGHYAASKAAVNGLTRTLAGELAPKMIRVNSINPTNVNTPMINNDAYNQLFTGGRIGATQADSIPALMSMNALPVPFVEPIDISNAVLYLASDASRFVTGTNMVVDAGALLPFKIPHEQ